jgi:heme exporter protein C
VTTVSRIDRWTRVFNWAAALSLIGLLFMIFFFSPTELTMGHVYRILYFHVGVAWVAAITMLVGLVAAILYLRSKNPRWDTISMASIEIGLAFTTMTIVSGSVWARPAWNTWWIWEPRLTSITVMWLVYAAYFMLRGAVEDDEKKRRFAAVYAILAFVTVIVTYASIRFLRSIHPVVVGATTEAAAGLAEGESEFAAGVTWRMGVTMAVSTITFTLVYLSWLFNRIRLQNMLDEAALLKTRLLARL